MKWIKLFESFNESVSLEIANKIFFSFFLERITIPSAKEIMDTYRSTKSWLLLQKAIVNTLSTWLLKTSMKPELLKYGQQDADVRRKEFLRLLDNPELIKIDWWTRLFLKWNADEGLINYLLKTENCVWVWTSIGETLIIQPWTRISSGAAAMAKPLKSMYQFDRNRFINIVKQYPPRILHNGTKVKKRLLFPPNI